MKLPKELEDFAGNIFDILEHITDRLSTSRIEELVLIVGYMKEAVESWALENLSDQFKLHFVEHNVHKLPQ